MNEAYKRELVRQWCEAVAAVPFVPTINENDHPLEAVPTWFTVEWQPDLSEDIAFCGVRQETGLLAVIVGGEPNLGDAAVAQASDAIVAELLGKADPQRQFTLERAQATTEHSAGSADRWYRLQTPLEYRFITGGQ